MKLFKVLIFLLLFSACTVSKPCPPAYIQRNKPLTEKEKQELKVDQHKFKRFVTVVLILTVIGLSN